MNEINYDLDAKYLFETSWEVCNKVGGIYTVIKTKIQNVTEQFGDNYFLIGPDLGNNPEFEETDEEIWDDIKDDIESRHLHCRYGRWNTPGHPRVILVNPNTKYDQNKLLYQLWEDYGVDSMKGEWDYIEPVLYSTAYGEVIEAIYKKIPSEEQKAIAQFHEWMSGAGMLYIKKHIPDIATVFTTHATMLGRSLAGNRIDIYSNLESISPPEMAAKFNITAKHSMEAVCARECDCFTTVSEITAREATHFFNVAPKVILPNGININNIKIISDKPEEAGKNREILLKFASTFLQKKLDPSTTRILLISGRYEFHNKGIELFLDSLNNINSSLKEAQSDQQIIAFLSVISGNLGISQETQRLVEGKEVQRSGIARICTHQLQDPQHDPISNKCRHDNLLNYPDDRVNIIFMPVYLDGYDGLLNLRYGGVLSGCDLGVFPSFYEPWGYTPLESIAYSVPTITTDLAGFGLWVKHSFDHDHKGVIILEYNGHPYPQLVESLTLHISDFLKWSDEEKTEHQKRAREIAEKADWDSFYLFYLKAYAIALNGAQNRKYLTDTSDYTRGTLYAAASSIHPRYRSFSVIAEMPENIRNLWDMANNLWWSWKPEIRELFSRLDPILWQEVSENPIELLEEIDYDRLHDMASNKAFLRLYEQALAIYEDISRKTDREIDAFSKINVDRPIAYFSTEYGLHQCLPIYSGGLGILSGDHLKSASNCDIPLVGVGLLYKSGYFNQTLDKEGNQVALYPENDFSRMPLCVCEGEKGNPIKIHVELPGRKLYAQAWKIHVGRVILYLLDTAVPENSNQDRYITARLYGADQRLRIEQEIMLGIGGVRLLDALGIKPAVFHLNEGHSAFLLLERVRYLMKKEKLTFHEAREVVKASSVFTTHSPVEAANERFEASLMKHYFSEYISDIDISWDTFWELGHKEPGETKPFFMTVLALKLCCFANGVSMLHGQVARRMWQNVWTGFDESEIPITSITNGIHTQSWIASEIKEVIETYTGIDFSSKDFDLQNWNKVDEIPEGLLWQTHQNLKEQMIEYFKKKMSVDLEKQGIAPKLIKEKIDSLNANALTIGFARRFAGYKRSSLVFSDLDRLSQLLSVHTQPVQIIFAGKAHPNDEEGKKVLKEIYHHTFSKQFIHTIFFIEDYDIEIAKYLVQGVDVWLNNPIRPHEASGTSGMKVIANGGLNLSIPDGWWNEAANGNNGWTIGEGKQYANMETQNMIDSQNLYEVLEKSVIPLYFDRADDSHFSKKWVAMMKESIKTLLPRFNTHRMLREYYNTFYLPSAERTAELVTNDYKQAKALTRWKLEIASRFSTATVQWVRVKGIRGDSITLGSEFEVEIGLELGRLSDAEVCVELVIRESLPNNHNGKPIIIQMMKSQPDKEEGLTIYRGTYKTKEAGKFLYGIRILPTHPALIQYQELGLVHWA